jgi:hypothetical protein
MLIFFVYTEEIINTTKRASVTRIFAPGLFNALSSPGPPTSSLGALSFFLKKFAKIMAKGTSSVIDNGGTFTAGIVVTGSRGGHIGVKSYPMIIPKMAV